MCGPRQLVVGIEDEIIKLRELFPWFLKRYVWFLNHFSLELGYLAPK